MSREEDIHRLVRELEDMRHVMWLLIDASGGEICVSNKQMQNFQPQGASIIKETTQTGIVFRSQQ